MVESLREAHLGILLFTLLSQMVVGGVWIVTAGEFMSSLQAFRRRLGRLVIWTGLPILGVAVGLSATPSGRWSGALLFGLQGLYAYLWYRGEKGAKHRHLVGVATSLAGFLAITMQSSPYMVQDHSGWNHLAIFLPFGATALMLGALLVGVITTLIAHGEEPLRQMYPYLAVTLLGSAALYGTGFIARVALTTSWAAVEASPLLASMELFFTVAEPLVAGLALVILCWHRSPTRMANRLIHSITGLILVGALVGRLLLDLSTLA